MNTTELIGLLGFRLQESTSIQLNRITDNILPHRPIQFNLVYVLYLFALVCVRVFTTYDIWQLIIVKPNALQMYTLPFEIIHRNDGWHSSRRNIRMKCRTFSKREKIARGPIVRAGIRWSGLTDVILVIGLFVNEHIRAQNEMEIDSS